MEKNKEYKKSIIQIIAIITVIIILIILAIYFDKNKTINVDIEATETSEEDIKLALTADDFDEKVLQADKPVLVDYYANWCGPCRMMAPILKEIAAEQNDFYVYKIDTDLYPALYAKTGARSIPLFVMYNKGEEIFRIPGAADKDVFVDHIYDQLEENNIEINK